MTDLDRCAVAATLKVIGGKWTPLVLLHLKDQPRRFNELRRHIPGITHRMLTLELRSLEKQGVVLRVELESEPPKIVEYSLTPQGLALAPIMDAMQVWGADRIRQEAEAVPAAKRVARGGLHG